MGDTDNDPHTPKSNGSRKSGGNKRKPSLTEEDLRGNFSSVGRSSCLSNDLAMGFSDKTAMALSPTIAFDK
jgi:hypothetical protein